MTLSVTSCAHFLVDFACAFVLFRRFFGGAEWAEVLLAYNFCAFALQMPLGLLADRGRRSLSLAALGCLLTVGGCVPLPALPAVILAGVGNALFHVGGGLEILRACPDRAGPLGVFVSPGALGLYVGTLLGRDGLAPLALPGLLLVIAAVCLLAAERFFTPANRVAGRPGDALSTPPGSTPASTPMPSPALPGAAGPLAGLFAVVVLRSLTGLGLDMPWKSGGWGLAAVCALALGKTVGGLLADRFGLTRTAAATLCAAAALFPLSGEPLCGLAAIFLFNMTMPLTLFGAARLLPGAKGFAFGLLTFALFLGFLPAYYGFGTLNGWWAGALALAALALLLPGLRKAVGS